MLLQSQTLLKRNLVRVAREVAREAYISTSVVVVYLVGPGTVTTPPHSPPGQLVMVCVEVVQYVYSWVVP